MDKYIAMVDIQINYEKSGDTLMCSIPLAGVKFEASDLKELEKKAKQKIRDIIFQYHDKKVDEQEKHRLMQLQYE